MKNGAWARFAPDPAWPAAVTIAGIVGMGICGAATLHILFNVATAIALVGAVWFVGAVALSARHASNT